MGMLVKLGLVAVAIGFWLWTQRLIGRRRVSGEGIQDLLHLKTAGLNAYFQRSRRSANALLISSSLLIDAVGLGLFALFLFGSTIRPFLGLFLIFLLRQINQALTALPTPPGMIWHDPGVPSVLVTYGVATDLFFSGHTAIAVFGATELLRTGSPVLSALGIGIAIYEIIAVILLRAHWTLDVFAGAVTALWISDVAFRMAPGIDAWLVRICSF